MLRQTKAPNMKAFGAFVCIGALGRNRTGTELPPTDFKSAASTCSATSASQSTFITHNFIIAR